MDMEEGKKCLLQILQQQLSDDNNNNNGLSYLKIKSFVQYKAYNGNFMLSQLPTPLMHPSRCCIWDDWFNSDVHHIHVRLQLMDGQCARSVYACEKLGY